MSLENFNIMFMYIMLFITFDTYDVFLYDSYLTKVMAGGADGLCCKYIIYKIYKKSICYVYNI